MFECHITLNLKDKEIGQAVADELHWSTSEIERDPLLGKASYFYLTTHDSDLTRMTTRMRQVVSYFHDRKIEVVREKIEVIIHDTKKRGVPAPAPAMKHFVTGQGYHDPKAETQKPAGDEDHGTYVLEVR